MAKKQGAGMTTAEKEAVGAELNAQLDNREIMKAAEADAALALDFNFDDLDSDLESVQVDVAGYWNPDGSPIFGELLGVAKAIETDLGVTGLYAIKLLRPCAGRRQSSQDSEPCVLAAGEIVGIFHSFGLNALKNMAGAKVALRRLHQVAISGGKTMWTYDIRADKARAKVNIVDNRAPDTSGAPF